VNLLREKRAARRKNAGHFTCIETGLTIQHQIEFAVGKRHWIVASQPDSFNSHPQWHEAFCGQLEVWWIILSDHDPPRPVLPQLQQSFTATCTHIKHR